MKPVKKKSLAKVLILFLLIVIPGIVMYIQGQDDLEAQKYRVAVNVMAVPLFAVDGSGNPVFDLSKDDLQLFVNGEPVDLLEFKRYEFTQETKFTKTVQQEEAAAPEEIQDRVIFIILDTMFNSLTGFKRGKEIAANLISEALPGDSFVILENNPVGGLKYVEGPERDAKILLKKIKKLNPPPEKWLSNTFSSRLLDNNVTNLGFADPLLGTDTWESQRQLALKSEKQRYQHQVRYFSYLLSQFRFALKTIDRPKIVFLISEGIALGAFRAKINAAIPDVDSKTTKKTGFYSILVKDEPTVFKQDDIYSAFMLNYLADVVKAINNGGSVLYTINPRRMNDINDDQRSGEMSLRYMAAESGGKYFAGAKPKKIIEGIKKTTSAYYEVFYQVLPGMGSDMKIKIECKRKDVNVHSLVHSEKNRPYNRMEEVQKKIFALNVVKGGSWSRIVGKVMQAKFKRSKAKGNKKAAVLTIPLPNPMQYETADIFLISQDPETQKTTIDITRAKLAETAVVNYTPKAKTDQYFVIIEPDAPHCIYNKI